MIDEELIKETIKTPGIALHEERILTFNNFNTINPWPFQTSDFKLLVGSVLK